MATPDPRWLEILKASGGQVFALAAASGTFLLLTYLEWIPHSEDWIIVLAMALMLLAGFLWLVSVVNVLNKMFRPRDHIIYWIKRRKQAREVERYIPFMNPMEREIVGYLLFHQQKTFTVSIDGGRAATLISRSIVERALAPGQVFGHGDMPVMIPDNVWDILMKHKDKFPYIPPNEKKEKYPWCERLW